MISHKKLERIKMHLLEKSKQVGGELRTEPRGELHDCPIVNFAPNRDSENRPFLALDRYGGKGYPRVYEPYDSHWWRNLRMSQRIKYTEEIIKWLKERDNGLL